MPDLSERTARLYFDGSCGPCTLLARAAEGVSHRQLVATPLDAPEADRDLGGLAPETRFAYAHLAAFGTVRSGDAVAAPLLGLALGPTWERVVRGVPWIDRSLRRAYVFLWEYRRERGCGAQVGP